MNVKQLRKVLTFEANHFREDGECDIAEALVSVANLLKGREHMQVSEFVDRVERARQRADLLQVRPNRRQRSR
jgi:hypothetical protein